MDNTKISDLTIVQKKLIMNAFVMMYKKEIIYRDCFFGDMLKAISLTDKIVRTLTDEQRLIFEQDYDKKVIDRAWYKEYWSKTKYYNIKNELIDTIVELWS